MCILRRAQGVRIAQGAGLGLHIEQGTKFKSVCITQAGVQPQITPPLKFPLPALLSSP